MDRSGIIYKKARSVDALAAEVFHDAIMQSFEINEGLREFKDGSFWGLGIMPQDGINVRLSINKRFKDLQEEVGGLATRFEAAGVKPEETLQYNREIVEAFKTKMSDLQRQMRELIQAYFDMSEKYDRGEIDEKKAFEMMGMVPRLDKQGIVSGYDNTKWPLANLVVLENSRQEEAYQVVSQFAEATFDFLMV